MGSLVLWTAVFLVSLVGLVKGADWLIHSSEKIGLSIGFSPFVVGVLVVSLGTSFPELIASLFAAFKDITEFAPANAVGSNLANILLVVGFSAAVAGRLTTTKNLINTELPLLAIGTAIFLAVAWDGVINLFEGSIMILTYIIYLLYAIKDRGIVDKEREITKLPSKVKRRGHFIQKVVEKEDEGSLSQEKPKITARDILIFVTGIIALGLGSKYLIDSVVSLSGMLGVGIGWITITAVAVGTSLPELLVSVKAAIKKRFDLALGNIFGSNAFNMMIVVGLPALFFKTEIDEQTYSIGLPFLAVTTFLFVISGISKSINSWEGMFYIFFYVIFISALLGFS
ncbi:MAG: calcium/sodium antiporter [Patescibacteria group bacterium]